jgi:hypothetical protein
MEESEWPPSMCKMYVFSSKSGCWKERDFVQKGDAAGTVGEARERYSKFSAAYFRGALYLHCQTDFLMRYKSYSPLIMCNNSLEFYLTSPFLMYVDLTLQNIIV